MSLFRIDKSSVSYKKNEPALVLPSAAKQQAALFPLRELEEPGELEEPRLPQEEEPQEMVQAEQPEEEAPPAPELPSPQELVERAQEAAAQILKAARDEAAGIAAKAALEAQEQKKAGYDQGYQEGFSAGEQEGISLYQAAERDAQALLASAIERFEGQRLELIAQMERECVALAMDISAKVLGETIEGSDFAFIMLAKHALDAIRHDGRVQLRVSPQEYQRFFAGTSGGLSNDTLSVTVVEDEGLKNGDLVLESDIESLNAGLRRQLGAIQGAIQGALVQNA